MARKESVKRTVSRPWAFATHNPFPYPERNHQCGSEVHKCGWRSPWKGYVMDRTGRGVATWLAVVVVAAGGALMGACGGGHSGAWHNGYRYGQTLAHFATRTLGQAYPSPARFCSPSRAPRSTLTWEHGCRAGVFSAEKA